MKVKVLLAGLAVLVIVLSGCSSGKDTITEALIMKQQGGEAKVLLRKKSKHVRSRKKHLRR